MSDLQNYEHIFNSDPVYWVSFRNTFIWTILSVIFPPFIGLLLALGLNEQIFGRGAMRAIYYLPVIIAPIAVATMWRWMYDPFFGLFNQLLTGWGLQSLIRDWLGDRTIALYSMFVAFTWQSVGFSMVLFLAGLQSVDRSLVEAARIDGANRWQVFRYVTLPALQVAMTIVIVLSTDHLAEGLRHRLRHDRRRSGAVDPDAGNVGIHPIDADLRLRPRLGDFGDAAAHHSGNRHTLSALVAEARGGGTMTFAVTRASTRGGNRAAPRSAANRARGSPWSPSR